MKYYLNHPLKLEPIEQAEIEKTEFTRVFNSFPWIDMLEILVNADEKEIKCSPSITLENKDGIGIDFSIVGEKNNHEFYICYKRPTIRKKRRWFKIIEYLDKDYHSIIPQQTLMDGLNAFNHLFEENFEILEKKWG